MPELTVSRDAADAPSETSDFFDEVKNGRDETTPVRGGYGSYPRIAVVKIAGKAYYVFDTSLDSDRGPWLAGFRDGGSNTGAGVWFDRDTVLDAKTLDPVDGEMAAVASTLADEFGDA